MQTPVNLETQSKHSTWIEINLRRLDQNFEILKAHLGPLTKVIAVVKANAYGHGLVPTAKALENKVAYFGISSLAEVHELLGSGIKTPLFLFGCPLKEELKEAIEKGITLSCSSLKEAELISELSVDKKKPTRVHVKIDTGMGRLGIPYRYAFERVKKIAAMPGIDLEGIYTHFPTADEEVFTNKQLYDFSLLLRALEQKGVTFKWRHASNSTATFRTKTPLSNLVRPGLMLYGIYSDDSLKTVAEVSPILSLKSRIALTKRLRPGESVGYGRDFIAERPTNIAVLPIGYSHGYPYALSGKASVLYRGKRYKLAGRVSMDYLCVNLEDDYAEVGDEITLIGDDGNLTIDANEIAAWAHTIPYEIVTRLSSKLPRLYSK